jgi:ABC-2 type transport system permease protein
VLDQDGTRESRELVATFEAAGRFRVTSRLDRPEGIAPLLARGRTRMVLVIPPGFSRDLAGDGPAPVQGIFDGADANTASIALNYAGAIVTTYSASAVLRGATLPVPMVPEARIWYNETLETAPMVVPGLVATIMMMLGAMLTALTVAREWERGTMEQLAATPVREWEVIAGKLLPYLVIGLIDVTTAALMGVLVFEVPFRGNPVLLAGSATMFLLGTMGLGIFISAALKTQLLATQFAMLATYLPALLLSGLIFDLRAMPVVLQGISFIVPARYFVTVLRGIFLKGVGLDVLWPQGLAMVAYAVIGLTLAVRAFRKKLA